MRSLRTAPAAQATHELFGEEVSYGKLSKLLNEGAIATSDLANGENLETFRENHPEAIMLFAIDTKGNVHPFTAANSPAASEGWKLIAISETFDKGDDEDAVTGNGR